MNQHTEPTQLMQDRLAQVNARSLLPFGHDNFESGMCVMEAVSYVAGEPWSDMPLCACPVITAFCVSWNDSLPSDAERDRLLKPFIPLIVGTRSSAAIEARRSYMALDWMIRVFTPKWLDLVPALRRHAETLRGLDAIVDVTGLVAIGERVAAVNNAISAAANTVPRNAALVAAGAAALGAAGDASTAVGGTFFLPATAPRSMAFLAVCMGSQVQAALALTTEWIQTDAQQLLRDMIAVQEPAQNIPATLD